MMILLNSPATAQPNRVQGVVDAAQRVTLAGHVHPRIRAANDMGRVDPSLALPYVTLTFAPSAAQQADLQQLLDAQQSPDSPLYHHWLTPDEYAARFGISEDDAAKMKAWAQGQGLSIAGVARGRGWIAVSGSAARIENAFQTSLHQYVVDGETHFANATEPSVPAAFAGVIKSVRGLNDFRAKPAKRAPHTQLSADATALYTTARGNHYLAPDDFSTIYDVAPLYAAGFNGSGQKLVIAGQTQINLSDIQQFRSTYNLVANDPQTLLVPNSTDPGISKDDLAEADLDIEWSGAVARNATIIYVYSENVMDAVGYAIDQNLAPVLSTSYGSCELETLSSDAAAFHSWAQQASVQGMAWFAASGDAGGADCNDTRNPGLAVDLPASIPEVTGVGGTEFVEGNGTFWNAANSTNMASALTAIPETSWNDSATDGEPSASGGGASVLFSKPSWQTAAGVPADNARHVPDIAMNASADHDGYLVYTGGSLQVYGGTSVPAPAFAGVTALLNQYLVATGAQTSAGTGSLNPGLYALAQNSTGIFRDVTTGDNIVTIACSKRQPNCTATGVGYNAGAGYDSVTGLGSVDVYNLVAGWKNVGNAPTGATSSVTLALLSNTSSVPAGGSVFVTATLSGGNGATPVGSVTFSAGTTSLGSATLSGSGGTATATLVVAGNQLPAGSSTITASYTPASSAALSASINVSVASGSGVTSAPAISGVTDAASYRQQYAPGTIVSLFGSALAPSAGSASSLPLPIAISGVGVLINGISAPLFYVSSTQLNIQIPYEVAAGAPATIEVNNNGIVASGSISVGSAAPGIFVDSTGLIVPSASATRGQTTTFYMTGAGLMNPAIATGTAPSSSTTAGNLPMPVQTVTVTVGGVQSSVAFAGNPVGLVGLTQVNFTIPSGVAIGRQPVVVTIGGVSSAPAYINVTG